MVVERIFHYPKPGRWGDMARLLKSEEERSPSPHATRIYSCDLGDHQIAMELEFESAGEREKIWAEYLGSPETAAFFEKYWELADRYFHSELWELL